MHEIRDPIHGANLVSNLAWQIISTPEFQRLNEVKQTGNAYRVYLDATHTRAAHSIGVSFVAKKFFDAVMTNSKKWREYEHYADLIQIAGLMHDIGHGPFSHLFQEAVCAFSNIFDHEKRSIEIFRLINIRLKLARLMSLKEEKENMDYDLVKDLTKEECLKNLELLSDYSDRDDLPIGDRYYLTDEQEDIVAHMIIGSEITGYPRFLFEIVTNKRGPPDADKMDYLVRDAYHTGIGCPNYSRIWNGAKVYEKAKSTKDAILTFKWNTRSEIQELYNHRLRMYRDVYYHPKVVKLDRLMICIIRRLNIDKKNVNECGMWDDITLIAKLRDIYPDFTNEMRKTLTNNYYEHHCEHCPEIVLERIAKLSNDCINPLDHIHFYGHRILPHE